MKLSVIVPVYNMAADGKLDYCLSSLVNQTVFGNGYDCEVIAVDDASSDQSGDILRSFAERYPNAIKTIFLPENLRQGGAKNRGLEICTGEYIGFMDSDDWAAPDMYERLLREAERTKADIVSCDHVVTDHHGMEKEKIYAEITPDLCGDVTEEKLRKLINSPGHLVTKIFSRRLFFEPVLRFPEHMFYEDSAVSLELLHRAKSIACVEDALYYYYQHGQSTVHTVSRQRCEDRMESMRIMLNYAKDGGYLDAFCPEIEYRFFNLFFQNTLFSYVRGTKKKDLAFIRRLSEEMRKTFPNFEKNPLYLEKTDPEEQRLIRLQGKSTVLFLLYDGALRSYRRIRYGSKRNGV